MDIILTPVDIQKVVAKRLRNARLVANFSQSGLATRAGVSLGTLKRFERTGEISLASLAKLAFALNYDMDFEKIFVPRNTATLDELLAVAARHEKIRQRGRHR